MSTHTQSQRPPSDYYRAISAGSSATRRIIESPTPPPNSTETIRQTTSASNSNDASVSEFRPILLSRSSFNYVEAETKARADNATADGQDATGDSRDSKDGAG